MSAAPEIRVYDYVNHGYEQVRALLTEDAVAVFQAATRAAAYRARSVAAQLRVDLGGVGIEAEIDIRIRKIVESDSEPSGVRHLTVRAQRSRRRPGAGNAGQGLGQHPFVRTRVEYDRVALHDFAQRILFRVPQTSA